MIKYPFQLLLFWALSALTLLSSCANEDDHTYDVANTIQTADNIDIATIFQDIDFFLDSPLNSARPRRLPTIMPNDSNFQGRDPNIGIGNIPIYIDSTKIGQWGTIQGIKTPRQLLNLIKETGAEISLYNDSTFTYEIQLSTAEVQSALTPLISDCKQYLCGKGFTTAEIDNLLSQHGAMEADLLPFALLLIEEEQFQTDNPDWVLNIDKSIFENINENNLETIDLERGIACILFAIGLDTWKAMALTPVREWTVAMLRVALTSSLTRTIGWVGAAIVVVEFFACYGW